MDNDNSFLVVVFPIAAYNNSGQGKQMSMWTVRYLNQLQSKGVQLEKTDYINNFPMKSIQGILCGVVIVFSIGIMEGVAKTID